MSWFDGSAADFIKGSKAQRGAFVQGGHMMCPPIVHVHTDRALAEAPVTIQMRTNLKGVEADLSMGLRLFYRFERRSGRWGILRLDAIYQADTLTPAFPWKPLAFTPSDFEGIRSSYRMIAYVFSHLGVDVPDDLYGDDRPEQLEAMYRDAFAWAGLPSRGLSSTTIESYLG